MITNIARWGNGQAIRLSKDIMAQANLKINDRLSISVDTVNENIILTKIPQSNASKFMELYGDYQGDWHCEEISTGDSIGKELIK